MIQKGKKRSAALDFHIQGGNLENLISKILKFRDKPTSGGRLIHSGSIQAWKNNHERPGANSL